jgi:hypothetical protein
MNNKASYPIKEIANKYKEGSFPRTRIPKELTLYLDLVFNQKVEPPKKEHFSEKEKDYFPYLIFDEKYKKVSFSHSRGLWNNNNNAKEEGGNDFFDNFKGKFNHNDVQTFKRNVEVTISNAVNLIVTNNRLLDFVETPGLKAAFKKDGSMSADEFFSNFEETVIKKGTYMKMPLIDCVYRLNERINYPKNKPLWYVYHAEADSSYGPLSSEDIEQMINSKLLEPESKLRLIDTFVYKGSKQFDFFPLKELQLDNFIDNIAISSLVYNFKVSNKNLFRKIDLSNVKDDMLYGKGKYKLKLILFTYDNF